MQLLTIQELGTGLISYVVTANLRHLGMLQAKWEESESSRLALVPRSV